MSLAARSLVVLALLVGCGGERDADRRASRPPTVAADGPVAPIGERVQARIPVEASDVCTIVAAGGFLWLADADHSHLTKVDPRTNRVAGRVRLGAPTCGLWEDKGLLYAEHGPMGFVDVIDPRTGGVARRLRLEGGCGSLDPAGDILWVVDSSTDGQVSKREAATGATLLRLPLTDAKGNGAGPCGVAEAAGSVWVGTGLGEVLRFDAASGKPQGKLAAGNRPESPVVIDDQLWFMNFEHGQMRQIDPRRGRITAIYDFGGGGLAGSGDDLWTVNSLNTSTTRGRDPILTGFDPTAGRVMARYRVGRRVREGERYANRNIPFALGGVTVAFGSVWTTSLVEHDLFRIDAR